MFMTYSFQQQEEPMPGEGKVNIGIVGTSWWADLLHIPALFTCDRANVVAICGRNRENTEAIAGKWGIPHLFTDYREMLTSGLIEAVVIVTPNNTHYPIAMAALNRGLHVMCEKPLTLNYVQAVEMAATAHSRQAVTAVPFTWRYMPTTRYIKHLIDEGYLGQPYHLNMCFYAGGGREPGIYNWRFDREVAGSGVLGDLASHFLYVAEWLFGEIEAVSAQLNTWVSRAPLNPQGQPYEQADDAAMLMVRYKNGAQGLIHASAVANITTPILHEFDFYGSEGTLHQVMDLDKIQRVWGGRASEGAEHELEIPARFWGKARREDAGETLADVFQKDGFLIHEFVEAVATGQQVRPNFADATRVQQLLDAALTSAGTGGWVKTTA
jgi:predicted dehydrogenase